MRGVDYWTESDIEAMEEDVIAVVGQDMSGILGLDADFENNTFTRMGEAEGKTAGAGFDVYPMYGGRRRCNVTDGGVVVAMQGESAYTETGALTAEVTVDGESYPAGTAVQVMVYQPKFYYRVQAMKREPIEGGEGYHLRRARYMVSGVARDGFRLHPAFVRNGLPRDYILLSAYEGSLWDADGGEEGTGAYTLDNAQVMSTSADKLCSIAGAKPVSGSSQQLTRANARALAHNRGSGWELQTIAALSCSQLLMAIEYASFNVQDAIGRGVNGLSGAVNTGGTASLGDASGSAEGDGRPGRGDLTEERKTCGGTSTPMWTEQTRRWRQGRPARCISPTTISPIRPVPGRIPGLGLHLQAAAAISRRLGTARTATGCLCRPRRRETVPCLWGITFILRLARRGGKPSPWEGNGTTAPWRGAITGTPRRRGGTAMQWARGCATSRPRRAGRTRDG